MKLKAKQSVFLNRNSRAYEMVETASHIGGVCGEAHEMELQGRTQRTDRFRHGNHFFFIGYLKAIIRRHKANKLARIKRRINKINRRK